MNAKNIVPALASLVFGACVINITPPPPEAEVVDRSPQSTVESVSVRDNQALLPSASIEYLDPQHQEPSVSVKVQSSPTFNAPAEQGVLINESRPVTVDAQTRIDNVSYADTMTRSEHSVSIVESGEAQVDSQTRVQLMDAVNQPRAEQTGVTAGPQPIVSQPTAPMATQRQAISIPSPTQTSTVIPNTPQPVAVPPSAPIIQPPVVQAPVQVAARQPSNNTRDNGPQPKQLPTIVIDQAPEPVPALAANPPNLDLYGPFRDNNDPCRIAGETAATSPFLDDSANLVACPSGSRSIGELAREYGGEPVADVDGYTLISVPFR
ncbi:hypothetical protein OAS86_02440 [Gammaproteobacteria bacterium]|nr:hypothetical protein [Gammaproteobacteria bacterium]